MAGSIGSIGSIGSRSSSYEDFSEVEDNFYEDISDVENSLIVRDSQAERLAALAITTIQSQIRQQPTQSLNFSIFSQRRYLSYNQLSICWRWENLTGEPLSMAINYIFGMIGYAFATVNRVVILVSYFFKWCCFRASGNILNEAASRARNVLLLGRIGEVGAALIGLVCPPLAYKIDEWIQSNPNMMMLGGNHWIEANPGILQRVLQQMTRENVKQENTAELGRFCELALMTMRQFLSEAEIDEQTNIWYELATFTALYALVQDNIESMVLASTGEIKDTNAEVLDAKEIQRVNIYKKAEEMKNFWKAMIATGKSSKDLIDAIGVCIYQDVNPERCSLKDGLAVKDLRERFLGYQLKNDFTTLERQELTFKEAVDKTYRLVRNFSATFGKSPQEFIDAIGASMQQDLTEKDSSEKSLESESQSVIINQEKLTFRDAVDTTCRLVMDFSTAFGKSSQELIDALSFCAYRDQDAGLEKQSLKEGLTEDVLSKKFAGYERETLVFEQSKLTFGDAVDYMHRLARDFSTALTTYDPNLLIVIGRNSFGVQEI